MAEQAKYVLGYFFDYFHGCLWSNNDKANEDFGFGPLDVSDTNLPLFAQTIQRCEEMAQWHYTSLNWDYPPDPGPWRQSECDRFNLAVRELLADIRKELGPDFEVLDHQEDVVEDPDLDTYLADPKKFCRP